ncbi:nucleolar complex protein 3 homolog [Copidosoma floridanum]|uniref:nucleolar complex protein 3 homolog n=1 Tax=Copidosoma floridanum TaxID=29053 RepID=UPI0006C980C8|nr:nucleolar complex protein 3 homolog [Copidosoma floridanum]
MKLLANRKIPINQIMNSSVSELKSLMSEPVSSLAALEALNGHEHGLGEFFIGVVSNKLHFKSYTPRPKSGSVAQTAKLSKQGNSSPVTMAHPTTTLKPKVSCPCFDSSDHNILLLVTAKVQIVTPSGQGIYVRALIDPCSQVSLSSKALAQALNLPLKKPLSMPELLKAPLQKTTQLVRPSITKDNSTMASKSALGCRLSGSSYVLKQRPHLKYTDVFLILLHINIKCVDFNAICINVDSDQDLKKNKNFLTSKKERIKKNKLERIKKEMLESKAEENQAVKLKTFTEIRKLLLTMFFRTLKQSYNSSILSLCLQGLLKLSSNLNLDVYQNIISKIIKLLDSGELSIEDELNCIQTAFFILKENASTFSIKPVRFCDHLYKNLLKIHVGQSDLISSMILKVLHLFSTCTNHNLRENSTMAFFKRISIMSLNLQHNSILGIFSIIQIIMRKSKISTNLFDTESNVGDESTLPESDSLNYCNAISTSLFEVVAWQKHYHEIVKMTSKNIGWDRLRINEFHLATEVLNLCPEKLHQEYSPTLGLFNPNVLMRKRNCTILKEGFLFTDIFNKTVANTGIENVIYNSYLDVFRDIAII